VNEKEVKDKKVTQVQTASPLKFHVMKLMHVWFAISLAVLIPGIIALAMGGLKLGIDFTGGSIMELRFTKTITVDHVYNSLTKPKTKVKDMDPELFKGVKISIAKNDNIIFIRSKHLSVEQQNATLETLKKDYGEISVERIESVGPSIGTELGNKALWAVVIVLGGILLYTSYCFRWDFAISIIICLAHDVFTCVGIFAILGLVFGTEIDSLFVTAVLGNAGYSVHDTIVVFDRIRENISVSTKGKTLIDIAEESVHQTFTRSINTSITTLLTLTALFLLGGDTIRDFVLAMMIGVFFGTYSSIFVASPIFVLIRQAFDRQRKSKKRALAASKA